MQPELKATKEKEIKLKTNREHLVGNCWEITGYNILANGKLPVHLSVASGWARKWQTLLFVAYETQGKSWEQNFKSHHHFHLYQDILWTSVNMEPQKFLMDLPQFYDECMTVGADSNLSIFPSVMEWSKVTFLNQFCSFSYETVAKKMIGCISVHVMLRHCTSEILFYYLILPSRCKINHSVDRSCFIQISDILQIGHANMAGYFVTALVFQLV